MCADTVVAFVWLYADALYLEEIDVGEEKPRQVGPTLIDFQQALAAEFPHGCLVEKDVRNAAVTARRFDRWVQQASAARALVNRNRGHGAMLCTMLCAACLCCVLLRCALLRCVLLCCVLLCAADTLHAASEPCCRSSLAWLNLYQGRRWRTAAW